jgi:hypothetical protein
MPHPGNAERDTRGTAIAGRPDLVPESRDAVVNVPPILSAQVRVLATG